MTTEQDFLEMIRKNPDDFTTRLVFADFLQDHGDPRADGFRALAGLRVRPVDETWFNGDRYKGRPPDDASNLPGAWFALLKGGRPGRRPDRHPVDLVEWRDFDTYIDAELAAVDAFPRLPAELKRRYLKGEYV